MFAPIANIPAPAQVNLVATPLPDSVALRVPSTNVSPSASSTKVENNASNNHVIFLEKGSVAPLPIPLRTSGGGAGGQGAVLPSAASLVPSEFLAQLVSSDGSEITDNILAQYEKLVRYGAVKYKPSNAGKPLEPTSFAIAAIPKTPLRSENKENKTEEVLRRDAEVRAEPPQGELEVLPVRQISAYKQAAKIEL